MLTMLDLQKYAKRAEADPGFRQRLLQDANRAIKDEFGEDLPYKLKCKEKLSFEVEPIENLSDAYLDRAAGGKNPPNSEADEADEVVKPGWLTPVPSPRGFYFHPLGLPQMFVEACEAIYKGVVKKKLNQVQNKAKHFTDGMGLNSNRK